MRLAANDTGGTETDSTEGDGEASYWFAEGRDKTTAPVDLQTITDEVGVKFWTVEEGEGMNLSDSQQSEWLQYLESEPAGSWHTTGDTMIFYGTEAEAQEVQTYDYPREPVRITEPDTFFNLYYQDDRGADRPADYGGSQAGLGSLIPGLLPGIGPLTSSQTTALAAILSLAVAGTLLRR